MKRKDIDEFRSFLGKFRITPEEPVIEDMTYVASRVKDLPHPILSSGVRRCDYCKNNVWVETAYLKHMKKNQKIMCTVCLMDRLKGLGIKRENISIQKSKRTPIKAFLLFSDKLFMSLASAFAIPLGYRILSGVFCSTSRCLYWPTVSSLIMSHKATCAGFRYLRRVRRSSSITGKLSC